MSSPKYILIQKKTKSMVGLRPVTKKGKIRCKMTLKPVSVVFQGCRNKFLLIELCFFAVHSIQKPIYTILGISVDTHTLRVDWPQVRRLSTQFEYYKFPYFNLIRSIEEESSRRL